MDSLSPSLPILLLDCGHGSIVSRVTVLALGFAGLAEVGVGPAPGTGAQDQEVGEGVARDDGRLEIRVGVGKGLLPLLLLFLLLLLRTSEGGREGEYVSG
jgi:hypothetical protein